LRGCRDDGAPYSANTFPGLDRFCGSNAAFTHSCRPWRNATVMDSFPSADEILKIADDSSCDYKKKIGADGKVTWVVDRAHIARCRLRIAARKRILAWMAPRKYGDR
jgi:hypothetical protein